MAFLEPHDMSSKSSEFPTEFHRQITGIVLAGGRSSRMGGINKALLHVQGRPMLEHIITRLQPQVKLLLINAPFKRQISPDAQPQTDYSAWGLTVVNDPYPDFQGPLAGMLAGIQACRTPYFLSVPCDTPFLPTDLSGRMYHQLQATESDLVFAVVGEHEHPVICMGKIYLADHLKTYLAGGDRKVSLWQKSLRYASVDFSDCAEAFRNLNTPQDIQQLDAENTIIKPSSK